jgi:hypothetical protein
MSWDYGCKGISLSPLMQLASEKHGNKAAFMRAMQPNAIAHVL